MSVFGPAIQYDNWFRAMVCLYSREWILNKPNQLVHICFPWTEQEPFCNAPLATAEQIYKYWGTPLACDPHLKEIFVFRGKEPTLYSFEEHQMQWTHRYLQGWSFLPYDMDFILVRIAQLQARCLRLPLVITHLIAEFAKDQITMDDEGWYGVQGWNDYKITTSTNHLHR